MPCPSLKVKLSPGLITVLAVASSPCFNWKPDLAIASATVLSVTKPVAVVIGVTAPVASVTAISPVLAATVWVFKCSPFVGVTVIKSLPLTSTASFAASFTSFLVTLTLYVSFAEPAAAPDCVETVAMLSVSVEATTFSTACP